MSLDKSIIASSLDDNSNRNLLEPTRVSLGDLKNAKSLEPIVNRGFASTKVGSKLLKNPSVEKFIHIEN